MDYQKRVLDDENVTEGKPFEKTKRNCTFIKPASVQQILKKPRLLQIFFPIQYFTIRHDYNQLLLLLLFF